MFVSDKLCWWCHGEVGCVWREVESNPQYLGYVPISHIFEDGIGLPLTSK